MLDFILPEGSASATQKSELRLASVHKSIDSVISKLEDGVASRRVDGVFKEFPQATLQLSFPSLETDNNTFRFNLRFPNKTIKDIATEIYLFDNVRAKPPTASSTLGKKILEITDKDGVILYGSIKEFVKNYKLSGSVSKLYSALRENKVSWDLSKLSASIKGKELSVQTYFHQKMNDYTICTVDYTPNQAKQTAKPGRAGRSGSLWG